MSTGARCNSCGGTGRYRKPYSERHVPCLRCGGSGKFRPAAAPTAHATGQLLAVARRVARLNPDCAEIGAGMLRSLVDDARAALAQAGEVVS